MDKLNAPAGPQQVPCEVCMKMVPRSAAATAEATDYVAYFCGLDCYERWKKQRQAEPVRGDQ